MDAKVAVRYFGLSLILGASSSLVWAQSGNAAGAVEAQGAASAAQRSTGAAGAVQAQGTASAAQRSASGVSAADGSATGQAMSGAGTAEATNMATNVSANVSAELTQKLSSKNAKVGDAVTANTLSAAQISNGTKLPKGTKLLGHVTEVQAKGGAEHDGHIAFVFDRAVLRDGQELPIHAGLRSISAPAAATTTDADALFAGGGGGSVGSGGGGGRLGGGLGGGLVGSGGAALGGASSALGSASGNVASTVGGTASGVQAVGGGAVDQTAGVGAGSGAGAGLGTSLAGGGGLTLVPVHNLPGVTANGAASSSANASGVLDARGRNVELSGGTQMVFVVSAN
jgi:hypothetical protein